MTQPKLSYLNLYTTDPAWNLAAEQYVFDALSRDRTYFMLWQNDNAIIIGKHQNAAAEINQQFVRENGVRVVRRLSGGGAVYHDMGNLNFTFIADAGDMESINFKLFCQPVVAALAALGVTAEVNGRNDMTIDGQKFSGNSQYLKEGRVMHHGTIMFDSDLDRVAQALHVDQEKIAAKGVVSVRSRVTTVRQHMPHPVELEEFRRVLLDNILAQQPGEEYIFTEADKAQIARLREQRYATWEWNYGQSRECEMTKKKRFPACGGVETHLSTDHGVIEHIAFTGDFFSVVEPEVLAKKLVGVRLEEQNLREALAQEDAGRYFSGLKNEELIELLLS